jgi:hypothetical protein
MEIEPHTESDDFRKSITNFLL